VFGRGEQQDELIGRNPERRRRCRHRLALDLVRNPDPRPAREAQEAAELTHDRLHAVLPRLGGQYRNTKRAEEIQRWRADRDQVETAVNELASEMRDTYPELTKRLADLFQRMAQLDEEVQRVNAAAPPGGYPHLLGAELAARGLDNFSAASPSITKELKLPQQMLWPPPTTPFAILAARAMPVPAFRGGQGDWWKYSGDRAEAQRADQERVAAYYAEQTRKQEEREAAERKRVPK
jgi:hypothetical protein